MADAKISALTAVTLPAAADLIAIVDDPAGTPATKKITHDDLLFGANTTPVTQAHGDSASVGNSLDAARANHVHGMPSVGEGAAKAWMALGTGRRTSPRFFPMRTIPLKAWCPTRPMLLSVPLTLPWARCA